LKTPIFVKHDGWQRMGLWYKGFIAIDNAFMTTGLREIDSIPEISDTVKPIGNTALVDHFAGEALSHGILPQPHRAGEILYRSGCLHQKRAPRSGMSFYRDHIPRVLGFRRNGQYKYGLSLQEDFKILNALFSLEERVYTYLLERKGHFFYNDNLRHGLCPVPIEAPLYALLWKETDIITSSDSQVESQFLFRMGDDYPGRNFVHGTLKQSSHNSKIYHQSLANYSWQGEHFNGSRRHSNFLVDKQDNNLANLALNDVSTGYYLYGGERLHHDGGGLRWKHYGLLLRYPFARHNASWLRGGNKRYLEARARYGDLIIMHDGEDKYGLSSGLHNSNILRQPVTTPEEMKVTIQQGYRRQVA